MKKAAVITGASSGIGSAIALEYSRNGFFVFLMGRNKDRLTEVALQCRAGASIMSCYLQDDAAVDKRLNEILSSKIHSIECLINCAGIYEANSTEDSSLQSWEKQFSVNLFAPVKITKAFLPRFKEQKKGAIVNISSTLGLRPTASTAAYSASKAAMNNWSQSLALELGAFNIRVNTICPGIVDTPIHGFHSLPDMEKNKILESMASLQPLGKIGSPENIAKAAYFLGSDDSAWTTGALLSVDGGINLK